MNNGTGTFKVLEDQEPQICVEENPQELWRQSPIHQNETVTDPG
jgi:hypothetical protein